MALKYLSDLVNSDASFLKDKKVVARFDFNVPLSKDNNSLITDATRIDEALPTIKLILSMGVKKLVLMSHLGRPKGKIDLKYSLEPVAKYLALKLEEDVTLSESARDRGIKILLGLNESKIILLQNLRFHPEEEQNDLEFARLLASYGDIYVNDAFGTIHRKHASTYEIVRFFKNKAFLGLLLEKEIKALDKIVQNPTPPFVAIVGGAKVSDKIKIIERLLPNVDSLLIGGAMSYPFLKAQNHDVGKSLCDDDDVRLAKRLLTQNYKEKIVLPIDHIGAKEFPNEFGGTALAIDSVDIGSDLMGLDIGEKTLSLFKNKLKNAQTILWNGPLGLFESKNFSHGTMKMASIVGELSAKGAYVLVGGGDSVAAVNQSGLSSKMNHVSTGGGAALEYIEQGTLPGIQALKFGID